jgi:hypothetical protein
MDDVSLTGWLRLREHADHSSRSAELTRTISAQLPAHAPVHVLDLATGAGSNLRYLAERLPPRQRWLVIDRSQALLSELEAATRAWARARGYVVQSARRGFTVSGEPLDCRVEMRARDLGVLTDSDIFEGRHLVTASALLDLVSATWLQSLAAGCKAVGAAALFTITYDGRFSCAPEEPEDALVRDLMNAHQRRDKGLGGPAEGPAAAQSAERAFAQQGYHVTSVASDWVLAADEAPMQRPLIEGWAEAATEMAPHLSQAIASWRARRLAHVDARRSHIVVSHRDVAAWLAP